MSDISMDPLPPIAPARESDSRQRMAQPPQNRATKQKPAAPSGAADTDATEDAPHQLDNFA